MRFPSWLRTWSWRDLVLVPYFLSVVGVLLDLNDIANVDPTWLFLGVNAVALTWMVGDGVRAQRKLERVEKRSRKMERKMDRYVTKIEEAKIVTAGLTEQFQARKLTWLERVTGKTRPRRSID